MNPLDPLFAILLSDWGLIWCTLVVGSILIYNLKDAFLHTIEVIDTLIREVCEALKPIFRPLWTILQWMAMAPLIILWLGLYQVGLWWVHQDEKREKGRVYMVEFEGPPPSPIISSLLPLGPVLYMNDHTVRIWSDGPPIWMAW